MTSPVKPICYECLYFDKEEFGLKCDAFPDGIPTSIIEGKVHDKPWPKQGNTLVFVPRKSRK